MSVSHKWGSRWGIAALLLGAVALALPSRAAPMSQLGVNQRVLVICVKYTDEAGTRMTTSQDWVDLLNSETNNFYNRATFGLTTFQFETPAGVPDNGWLSLGYAASNYDFFRTGQDAVRLIDPYVDFTQYNRCLVITNWWDFGGQGGGPWWWHPLSAAVWR